jgi:hypothetical protein
MRVAGKISTSSPRCTDSSLSSPQPNTTEPKFIEPLAFLPSNISDIRLAQPFSASSSNFLSRIPTVEEVQVEIEGQTRMAAKVAEVNKRRRRRPESAKERKSSGGLPKSLTRDSKLLRKRESLLRVRGVFRRTLALRPLIPTNASSPKLGWSADFLFLHPNCFYEYSTHMASNLTTYAPIPSFFSPT